MNTMQPSEPIKKKPGSEKTAIELAQEYGELLIKGPFDNNWVDKVKQLNKEFSVSDKRIKPFLDLVCPYIDPHIRFQLVNILLQDTYTDPKTFLRGNCFARDVFLYYNNGAEFNDRVERFVNYDPDCITNITKDIPEAILQQFALLNIPPENLYRIFSFNYINPKFMRALEERKIRDPDLTLLAAACGEIIGKKNVLKDLDTSEDKTGTLDKLRKQAKTPSQLDAINSAEPKIRKLITGMHNAGVEAQFANITERYSDYLVPNPKKNVIPAALSETQCEENFQKFKAGLNPPTTNKSLGDRVKENFLVSRLSSAWTTFISGVQSAWKSVISTGSTAKGNVDVSEKAPLTQVTSNGENQTERKKSIWSRFKDFVTSKITSPEVSETTVSIKSNISATASTGNVNTSNKSNEGTVTLAPKSLQDIRSASNYVDLSPLEKQLKNNLNDAVRKIEMIKSSSVVDIKMSSYLLEQFNNNEYHPLAENIKALTALKNSENEHELKLVNSALNEVLLHLDKCINEQDKKIETTTNLTEREGFTNARNALLSVRDQIADDFKLKLPEESKYISIDKPNPETVTKIFIGPNYQHLNSSNKISENDLQKINEQLSKDLRNLKDQIASNSGKITPEIKKAIVELHNNLNAFKERVNKFVSSNSDLQNAYGEKGGVKDQYLCSVKDIEDQAKEINKQMLGADKKNKWGDIASSFRKLSDGKPSVTDLYASLKSRIGNQSPRSISENPTQYSGPVDNPTMNTPSHSEPSTPRSGR